MKRFLQKLDNTFRKIVHGFLGCSMILLTLMTFLQVLFRYVMKQSMGGYEELPIYLMIISTWFAASVLTAEDKHIGLDVITLLVKNKRVLTVIDAIMDVLTAGGLAFFSYCMFVYMVNTKAAGTISSGIGFPKWLIALTIFVNGALMLIYTIKNAVSKVREAKHGSID